jgi:dihydroflavonol-4-reductase
MRVLVTGGAGFIGHHLVARLVARGDAVRVLHLPGERLDNLAGLDVEAVAGDVTDRAAVRGAVEGMDAVFHVAAMYALWTPRPERMWDVNVQGTRIVLSEAFAAGVQRVVHTSSIAVYGGQGPDADATEASPFRLGLTGDVYSASKYAAHQVAKGFADRGHDVVIVAPTGPVGPGDIGPTPTGRLLRDVVRRPVPVVTDTASNFIDVRTCALGHLLALERGVTGESYLLAGENWHLRDLARAVLQARGRWRPVVTLPLPALAVASRATKAWADRVTHRAPSVTPAAVRIARRGLRARGDKAFEELGLPRSPVLPAALEALAWFDARSAP